MHFEKQSPEGASVPGVEIQLGGFRAVERLGELWQVGNRRVDAHVAGRVAVEEQLQRHRSLPAKRARAVTEGERRRLVLAPPNLLCPLIPSTALAAAGRGRTDAYLPRRGAVGARKSDEKELIELVGKSG